MNHRRALARLVSAAGAARQNQAQRARLRKALQRADVGCGIDAAHGVVAASVEEEGEWLVFSL